MLSSVLENTEQYYFFNARIHFCFLSRVSTRPCPRRFFVVLFRANMADAGELVSATLRSIVFVEKHMRKGGAVQPIILFEIFGGADAWFARLSGGYCEQRRGTASQIEFVLTNVWYTIFALSLDISAPKWLRPNMLIILMRFVVDIDPFVEHCRKYALNKTRTCMFTFMFHALEGQNLPIKCSRMIMFQRYDKFKVKEPTFSKRTKHRRGRAMI